MTRIDILFWAAEIRHVSPEQFVELYLKKKMPKLGPMETPARAVVKNWGEGVEPEQELINMCFDVTVGRDGVSS